MDGGLLIREARLRAGLTQAELARRAATSQSAIARYERGDVSPRVDTLDRIVAACGLELRPSLVVGDDGHDASMAFHGMSLTPAQRFRNFLNLVSFAERLRAAKPIAS